MVAQWKQVGRKNAMSKEVTCRPNAEGKPEEVVLGRGKAFPITEERVKKFHVT